MTTLTHPLLMALLVPLLGGLLCWLPTGRRLRGGIAISTSAVTLLLVGQLFAASPAQLNVGALAALRVDALSAFVVLAIAAFGLLVGVYSAGYLGDHPRHRQYFAYLLWTLAAALGAVLANDVVTLLVCWGFLGLTLYLMALLSGPGAADAARKALMLVGASDALLVLGAALLWGLTGSARLDADPVPLQGAAAHVAFLAFAAAAFAKAGAVPLHGWVPDYGERALPPVSAFLPASLDKLLGIYLLARCALDLFTLDAGMNTLLMALGAVTILAAVISALTQHDLKRLLAWHAVSQVGYMVLGIGSGTAIGIAGGLFHMLNHAIYKSCLFLCAGAIEQRAGTTDLDRLGGLSKAMPYTFGACLVAALSISGIPPLNGFASKWMVYQGIISSAAPGNPGWVIWLAAAMLGSALTLASFVKVLHATFLCKPTPEIAARHIDEVGLAMRVPMVLLAVACIAFGVFADAVPLGWLIYPAVGAVPSGVWWSGLATLLILIAIGGGALIYALTMRGPGVRRTRTYVGGEHLDQVYVHGEPSGPGRHVEVTGVDFYRTIEELPVLGRLYALARRKAFDLSHNVASGVAYLVGWLRGAHSGSLAMYLTWFLGGALWVMYVLTARGPQP